MRHQCCTGALLLLRVVPTLGRRESAVASAPCLAGGQRFHRVAERDYLASIRHTLLSVPVVRRLEREKSAQTLLALVDVAEFVGLAGWVANNSQPPDSSGLQAARGG